MLLKGRAVFGFAAIICQFIAIQHIPVADAIVISSCSSVLVGVVAQIFLKEKYRLFSFITAILTIVGIGIMTKPSLIREQKSIGIRW